MARKNAVSESNISEGKQLINVGEHRREWIRKVSDLSAVPINEVMRCLIDTAAVEDPESYAVRIKKYQAKQKLEDIERRERALEEEKKQYLATLEGTQTARQTAGRG